MRVLLTLLATVFGQVPIIVPDGEDVDIQQCSVSAQDMTMIPGSHGEAVARAVHSKLVAQLNTDDRGFMMNFAFVETEYGAVVLDRYEMVHQIWAITREQFELTKEHYMKGQVKFVDDSFNIDWQFINYEELNVPLYSGIAFHLYLFAIEAHPIAWGVEAQAELYAQISAQATIKWTTYMAKLVNLNSELCKKSQSDIVFLVDESGSIGEVNFQKMLDFVSDVIGELNVDSDHTRVAMRTFSDPNKVTRSDLHFTLNDYGKDLKKLAKNVGYSCDSCYTYTDKGIEAVLDEDFKTDAGMREAAKRILVVITDGESTEPLQTAVQASRLHSDERNIQVIAIGVGKAKVEELNRIASSRDLVFFLDSFSTFSLVTDAIAEAICNTPIMSEGNGTAIIGLVGEGTAVTSVDAIIGGNMNLVLQDKGIIPGYTNFHLTLNDRTIIKISSTASLEIYMSYSQVNPSPADYDYRFHYTDAMASSTAKGQDVQLRVVDGTKNFYIAAYNYGATAGIVYIEVLSFSVNAPENPNPIPIRCGMNAHCESDGTCACNDGYFGNAYDRCKFDLCFEHSCDNGATCNPSTGKCECREGYALVNGVCQSPLCPLDPVIATENQYGYAMGYLSSPFYGVSDYPTNFDCEYKVTAPRTNGSCYEFHIEHPFALETSRSCRNDRLEVFEVENAQDITMDHTADEKTVVLCGNACIAEGGWIGRTCGSDLRLRFKSDSLITAEGWKIKWILRPKEDCDCWCHDKILV